MQNPIPPCDQGHFRDRGHASPCPLPLCPAVPVGEHSDAGSARAPDLQYLGGTRQIDGR